MTLLWYIMLWYNYAFVGYNKNNRRCTVHVLKFYVYGFVHRWSTGWLKRMDSISYVCYCSIDSIFWITLYIKNCPTRCSTKQSIYYSASSLYMFRLSTTPIITSTQNCNYSLRYWSYFFCSYLPPTWQSWPRWMEVAAVPEAVVTVMCIPDDECGWHPKHVE